MVFNDFSSCLECLNTLLGSLWGSPRPPRSAPESPSILQRPSKTPQGHPRDPQGRSQDTQARLRSAQGAPKDRPGTPRDRPRIPQRRPGRLQGAKRAPKESPETPKSPKMSPQATQKKAKHPRASYPQVFLSVSCCPSAQVCGEGGNTPTRIRSVSRFPSQAFDEGQHTHARQISKSSCQSPAFPLLSSSR